MCDVVGVGVGVEVGEWFGDKHVKLGLSRRRLAVRLLLLLMRGMDGGI